MKRRTEASPPACCGLRVQDCVDQPLGSSSLPCSPSFSMLMYMCRREKICIHLSMPTSIARQD